MVKETIDLNINRSESLILIQKSSALQRSSSDFVFMHSHDQTVEKDTISPANCGSNNLQNSVDHLNWKFLEQVSNLDNQLRKENEKLAKELANGDSCAGTHTSDVKPLITEDLNKTIIQKLNGFSLNGNISDDIYSQQSLELKAEEQHLLQHKQYHPEDNLLEETTHKFEFTTPTATFKRKKEQALKREQSKVVCQVKDSAKKSSVNGTTIKSCKAKQSLGSSEREMLSSTGAAKQVRTHTLPKSSVLGKTNDDRPHTSRAIRRNITAEANMSSTISSKSNNGSNVTGKVSIIQDLESHLGLFGWRKKCLYALLFLLMLLIITNLVLTLWILKVMEFTTDGMGQLKIVPGGVQLTGQAFIMDVLRASTIRSRHGQPIAIESSRNFSINTRDTNGMLENHLFLGHDKLECLASEFRINDTAGRNLFSVNRNEVTIGAHALRIEGEGGAIFRESIQTPHVRAEPGRELRLESPTRQLEMTAAKDINLQSRAGGIEISALADVKLTAHDGSIRLESTKILMPNLRTVQPPLPGTAQNREHLHRVFQLCACSNGKLFLASPHSICAGDDSTVCR